LTKDELYPIYLLHSWPNERHTDTLSILNQFIWSEQYLYAIFIICFQLSWQHHAWNFEWIDCFVILEIAIFFTTF